MKFITREEFLELLGIIQFKTIIPSLFKTITIRIPKTPVLPDVSHGGKLCYLCLKTKRSGKYPKTGRIK
jgi:hypothetical protein